jgi:hypothetical protein
MDDQFPALLFLMFATMMFGAFEYYSVPYTYQVIAVFMVCGIPLVIMMLSAYLKRKKSVEAKAQEKCNECGKKFQKDMK